jgi:hypothetical protein
MRLATRFKNQEVVIKETSCDTAWIGTIKRITREAGEPFYEIDCEGELINLAVSSVEWIKPRKAIKVLELNKLTLAPFKLMQSKG